ncbi:MAG TPA: hypothetical protein DEA32_02275 [Firmicutes bacterium]|nr:hypothetical protein [Bacillota bacterium]
MITVKKVETLSQRRAFVRFPLRLYKGVKEFVPALYMEEKKILSSHNIHRATSESVFFLAYEDGKVVGRIQGILQRAANEKWQQSRIRFTRFDCIDSQAVAHALFGALEDWGRELGMQEICGPLGYTDFDREGLLIQGFDQDSTFEEQYNFPYYQKLIENEGFVKDVDWLERKIFPPKSIDPRIQRIADRAMKKNGFRFVDAPSVSWIIKKYGNKFFDLLEKTYGNLYGVVPFNEAEKKDACSSFKTFLTPYYVRFIVDSHDNLVAFGVCFPAIGDALKKSGGRLTIPALIKVLRARRDPEVIDLGLIGVAEEHRATGVSWAILLEVMKMLNQGRVKWCETNLNLEDNEEINDVWKHFGSVIHKRRRSFVKKI